MLGRFVLKWSASSWQGRCTRLAFMSNSQAEVKEKSKGPNPTHKQILMKLRRKTGFPIMKCKQALVKCEYDFSKAAEALQAEALKEGWSKMESLSGRVARQGLVTAYKDENYATLVEINCESDFVAKTTEFQSLVGTVARTVLHHYSKPMHEKVHLTSDELLNLKVPDKELPVQDLLASTIGKLKENIKISRGVVLCTNNDSSETIGVYTHPETGTPRKGGKLPLMGRYAALVCLRSTALEPCGKRWLQAMGRDAAQHVVGMNPTSIGTARSPKQEAESATTETEAAKQAEDSPAEEEEEEEEPTDFLEDSDELVNQPFLLDANITVQNWLDINRLTVLDFVRYQVGGTQEDEEDDG